MTEKTEKAKKSKKRRERKTYVISSIQAVQSGKHSDKFGRDSTKGAPHKKLLDGLRNYCDRNNAELILLTMAGMDINEQDIHPYFSSGSLEAKILTPDERNIRFNNNCVLADFVVPPQNVDPTTGRDRLIDTTTVFAHPKQRLRSVASGPSKQPKLLLTTGAATYPNFNRNNSRQDLAHMEHKFGAVVVEVIDSECFNARHLQAFKSSGRFIDMARAYDGDKLERKKVNVEALILGDIHKGDDDPLTMQANYEMIQYFKPRRLFLHDFLNGHSVNPHEQDNLLQRTTAYESGRLSLEAELKAANTELVKFAQKMNGGEVHVVFSNHPFFVERYLESGRWIKEPWNAKIAATLTKAMLEGENPVEYGIKMMGGLPENVNFQKLRDDYRVWGWQLATHGHKGISGARGSVKSQEKGYRKSISGHTHAPEILRDTIKVGTSTRLDLPYTDGGMSTWLGANAVLYEGGQVQLLPIINGKWKMKRK